MVKWVLPARSARRIATGAFLLALVTTLFSVYVALVFYENTVELGAETVAAVGLRTWTVAFSSILVVSFGVLVTLYLVPRESP